VVIWKPYYLFTAGFKEPVWNYWKGVARNYAISAFAIGASLYTIRVIPISPYHTILDWVLYAAISMVIFLTYDLTATLLFAKGAKDSLNRIKNIRKR
jgi:hypothetical protein